MQADTSKQGIAGIAEKISPTQRLSFVHRWPSQEAKRWVESFVEVVCSNASTAAVVLLGSTARSAEHVNDVDILYIFKDKRIDIPGRSIDVDLRAYAQENVPSLIGKGNDLLGWALNFGYLIYERELYWTSLRREWLGKFPFPDPEVAKERARRADEIYLRFREIGDIDAAKEQLLIKLTHEARALLLSNGIYPRSRPELPAQLRSIGRYDLARSLKIALMERNSVEVHAA